MGRGKNIGYIRVSTDKQDADNQRLSMLDYANANKLTIDDFLSVEISSRKSQHARRIEELLERLNSGDVLIVTELSRLARSTLEVITLVNELVSKKVGLTVLKQGIRIPANGDKMDANAKTVITIFGLMAELERDMISERTKMGLAARKAAGIKLGKPRGTIQSSKLDGKRETIVELLKHRVAVAAIARMIGTSRSNLINYLKTRPILVKVEK